MIWLYLLFIVGFPAYTITMVLQATAWGLPRVPESQMVQCDEYDVDGQRCRARFIDAPHPRGEILHLHKQWAHDVHNSFPLPERDRDIVSPRKLRGTLKVGGFRLRLLKGRQS